MKVKSKQNVCVYIKDQAQLIEARQILKKYGEKESNYDDAFIYNNGVYPYLRMSTDNTWYLSHWNRNHIHSVKLTEISLLQLEKILKQ